ncbi:hypothetical protein SAMN05216228_101183 [Rhizobium tibeticum]|uniref:Uncharacterized protein n=1 Tax=Rhizobium tibeticum TaxID=501024 RepID=A0A1H8LP18_9HYPH|nr:hypothetical protein [Rhizobium tibeticum]SEH90096.1 hypothetical protein RTCCBAU85039_2956 [Rhizobium tibeticum]SEO06834.1 hypothetical protein SAMN05216228_101183 [Rhizobium tibeticum]
MQAVLVAMTILGCNDSVTQCNYIATVEKQWQSVAMCDADSERQLKHFTNVSYPTVIAVCEPPKPATPPDAPKAVVENTPKLPAPAETQGRLSVLADRVAGQVRAHLPSGSDMKTVLVSPVHFVSGSYSWVAKRLGP